MMTANRKLLTAIWFGASILAISGPGAGFAQERPGIHSFVNIPEACYLTEPVQPESVYSFTKVQIQALWLARKGEESIRDILSSGQDLPDDEPARLITGLRTERIQTTCASFVISAFAKSGDKNIAAAAQSIALGYQQLTRMTDEMLPSVIYAGVESMHDPVQAKFSDWVKRHQETVAGLTESLYLSLSFLVDPTRVDSGGKLDHLILTAAERKSLLDDLNSKFPSLQKDKAKPRPGGILGQASLIYTLLTGSLKNADSQ